MIRDGRGGDALAAGSVTETAPQLRQRRCRHLASGHRTAGVLEGLTPARPKVATAALVAAYGARAARLKHRVRAGGHHVPDDKIRKRQRRLWTLVAEAITACDIATVYDNSRLTGPRIVAQWCARACGA